MLPAATVELLATEPVRPITRVQYEQMVDAGVFGEDDPIELLHGMLVEKMSPQGAQHANAIEQLSAILYALVGRDARVRVQLPLAAGRLSLPEPDLCLVPTGPRRDGHPDRALLVIEVADTSLHRDRATKSAIYATANVPEYWIVDLGHGCIEVYTEPLGDHYGTSRVARTGDRIELVALTGRWVAVDDVFAA